MEFFSIKVVWLFNVALVATSRPPDGRPLDTDLIALIWLKV